MIKGSASFVLASMPFAEVLDQKDCYKVQSTVSFVYLLAHPRMTKASTRNYYFFLTQEVCKVVRKVRS